MPRPPNYSHERNERDRAKAIKKAEKLEAKAAARKAGNQPADKAGDAATDPDQSGDA